MMEKPSPVAMLVTIGICTSAVRSNVKAFIAKVSSLTNVTVRFIELPYNDLDGFRLSSEGLDGLIICHSINNRRFAITDVMDALYDDFLLHVKKEFGKGNVCVIAHDFEWPMGPSGYSSKGHARIRDNYIDSFRSKQPTTFKCCNLALICGRLDKQVDMDEGDWTQLKDFVRQCRVQPQRKDQPESFMSEIFGFKIDLRDKRFLWVLVILVIVLLFLLPHIKRLLYRSLKVGAYYVVLFLLVPFICGVYHNRGKGPQIFKNKTSWASILILSILLLMYVVVKVYRAGGYVAFLFPLLPLFGIVYQKRKQGAKRSRMHGSLDHGTFQWSRPPWWKFPYQFWRHFIDVGAKYVNKVF